MGTRSGVFRIARIGGIDIKASWSWLLVLLLITFQLAAGWFPTQMPGDSALVYGVLGLIASLLLFASVLLHELSHSFTARALGHNVHDITLFIFGGVSNIEGEPKTARNEFLIAVVGPLTSIVLAGVFYALEQVVTPPVRRVGAGAAAILQYLALINLLLGLFNLIPGFPLDGGRVLRAFIWAITRNFQSATRIAGLIGELVAYGFIFYGLYMTFFQGDFSGLWLAFIGWFLLNAAQQSVASVVMRETFRGITAGQVMEPAPQAAAPHMTLAHLLTQFILPNNARAVPVVQDGRLVGIVTLTDIKDVPQDQWGTVTIGQVMAGPDKLRVVSPSDGLEKAMQLLGDGDYDQLPVVDPSGHLLGILTRARVLRWLQIRDELKLQRKT
ncbi:MAG: M50 family metallopeptidase [Chloroflexia bacterium]